MLGQAVVSVPPVRMHPRARRDRVLDKRVETAGGRIGDPTHADASDAPASTAGDTAYWGRLSQVDTPRGQ